MVLDDIEVAKKVILENMERRTNTFFKLYPFSNENLEGYFKFFQYYHKSALVTGSSSDQVLNLINHNCNNITFFDINPFIEYYFGLKKAAIQVLEPKEFLSFFGVSFELTKNRFLFNEKTYVRLESYLDDKTKLFWESLFNDFNPKIIGNNLFIENVLNRKELFNNLGYLQEKNYYLLRDRFINVEISFLRNNLIDLDGFEGKYDYIFLSNIFDYIFDFYSHKGYLKDKIILLKYYDFIMKLLNLLNDDGKMLLHYFWNCSDNEAYYKISSFFYRNPHFYDLKFANGYGITRDFDSVLVYQKK